MIKKTITYEDFNGKEHTEDFYFNLSKAELTRMEMRETTILNDTAIGGLNNRIQAVVDAGSGKDIINIFESLLKESYGVRSADGKQFVKNDEVLSAFVHSNAYDVLFMELVTDAKAAAEFVNGIVPKDLGEGVIDASKKPQDHKPAKPKNTLSVVKDQQDVETVEKERTFDDTIKEVEAVSEQDREHGSPWDAAEKGDQDDSLTAEEKELLAKLRSGKSE